MKELEVECEAEIVKRIGEMSKMVGWLGSMDFMMDWR